MSRFDQVADQFEAHRSIPSEILSRIRQVVCQQLPVSEGKVLEIGAGTGRFGKSFLETRHRYFGIDNSFRMLSQFSSAAVANLAQAHAGFLPFPNKVFCAILLFHFFGGSEPSDDLFAELSRVLTADGVVIVGQRVGPKTGVDAQMRDALRRILSDMRIAMPEPGKGKRVAQENLNAMAKSHQAILAASWKSDYTPNDFLKRHRTGAWFSQLEIEVQKESLDRLSSWALQKFTSLDAASLEEQRFDLDIFTM